MAISLEFTLKRQDFEESLMIYNQSKPYLRYVGIFTTYIVIILFGFLAFLKIYGLINNDLEISRISNESLLLFPVWCYSVI